MENKSDFKEESKRILKGLEKAYEKMIQFKRLKNTPLVISVDGEVKEISPYEAESTTTYSR
ncbi:MAG TPA: hypothetical protein DEQ56_04275 [Bacteroidetes bacterium]|jgi:hypothetical protein|nr:hypothetical protein [Bacteroidota bacterium]